MELPKVDKIPAVRFDKAKELVAEKGMYMEFLSDRSSGQENDRYDPFNIVFISEGYPFEGYPCNDI